MKNNIATLVAVFAIAWAMLPGQASSHREAPLTATDPMADNTDVYAWRNADEPDKVTLISNFIPFQSPNGGPNFYQFDPNVVYEIHVDNNGDAVEDITFQWRFTTEIRNPRTFLYNTGEVTTLDDPDLNVRQFYRLTRIDGPRRTGTVRELSGRLPVPPPNIGPRSTPNYGLLAGGIQQLPGDIRVFAGQRDEGFYVDLGIFDLLGVGSGEVQDSTAGFNVSSLAIQMPIAALTRTGAMPSSANDPSAVIGVWSTASRFASRTLTPGAQTHAGALVQVSRLGNPLVNEAVIDLARKDAFNGLEPTGDAVALDRVTDPEVPKLLDLIFGVQSPPAPRNDLVTIFLTGIPGLNQPPNVRPAELLRLNVAIQPTSNPDPGGVLRGDNAGFPTAGVLAMTCSTSCCRRPPERHRSRPRSIARPITGLATTSIATTCPTCRSSRTSESHTRGTDDAEVHRSLDHRDHHRDGRVCQLAGCAPTACLAEARAGWGGERRWAS